MMIKHLFTHLSRIWPAKSRRKAKPTPDGLESRAAITEFLFIENPPQNIDLCFVLGCPTPTNMDAAISLYERGLTSLIMISGHGPAPQAIPEAVQFRDYAIKRGIPEAAILLETESTNTLENFVFSAPIIAQHIGWSNVQSIAIVSKPYHARRALMTARRHWPAHLHLVMQPSLQADDILASNWWQTESGQAYVMRELIAIGTYAQKGDIGGY